MNRDEIIENLGTIARSGSQAFLKELEENENQSGDGGASENIIG